MPIIEIESLPVEKSIEISPLLQILSRSLSAKTGIPEERINIIWRAIKKNHFVSGGKTAETVTGRSHHPVVKISYRYRNKPETELLMIEALVEGISEALLISPENVVIIINRLPEGTLFAKGRFI